MEKETVKVKKTKKKLSKGALVLIIGCVIILIPCLIFGGILISASLKTGTPSLGNRFDNDLNPAISDSQTKSLEAAIKTISNVEDCNIVLTSAQYRVNVNTNDSLSSEQIEALAKEIYDKVDSNLPIATYFTMNGSNKMYDLSINVYNYIDSEDENMIYYILTKNSKMDTYSLQCVSEPVDEELAKELRGEVDTSVGTGDVQVEESQEEVTE